MEKSKSFTIFAYIFFALLTMSFIVPFFIIIAVSISNEEDIARFGFSLIPRKLDFTAYSMLFNDFTKIGRSMLLTAAAALVAPAISCLISSPAGYVLTRPDYRFKKVLTWYILITMLFNGGLVPTYIVYTKYLSLGNNVAVYFVTGLTSAWMIILYRTFFKGIPESLIESAHIDGAGRVRILISIIAPMSKTIFAIQYFSGMISRWNEFQVSLLYMSDEKWFTIQYFMKKILDDAEFLKKSYAAAGVRMETDVPLMGMRYAMCVVAILPIFVVFPFVQRYFARGISMGSVKG